MNNTMGSHFDLQEESKTLHLSTPVVGIFTPLSWKLPRSGGLSGLIRTLGEFDSTLLS